MPNRTWNFDIDGKSHKVLLKFGLISGRQIWLDGALINKGRNTFEMGSEYHFSVDGNPAELGIVSTPAGYEYYFRVNNEFVFASNDKRKKIGKSTAKKFEQRQIWIDIGRRHGLDYLSLPLKKNSFQHRLIGYLDKFLVVIAPGFKKSGDSSIPGIYILIRHATIDGEKIKELKSNKDTAKAFKENKIPIAWLEIQPGLTTLFVNSGLKKTDNAEMVDRLITGFQVLSKALQPVNAEKCEGSECKSPYFTNLTLMFVNGVPFAMCQDCIDHIDDIGKKAEEEYKKQPSNLGKGILYGLAAAFLGAIVWALILIFMNTIGAVFAILIFFLVIKAMDYAKTKRTFISLFIAALLSLAGSLAGTYFGVAGFLFKQGKFEPTLSEFIWLTQHINHKLINDTIFFSLIGLVPYLFITWNANRSNLKRYFKPEVETINGFELK